jgi:homoserine O-acetyltransferase
MMRSGGVLQDAQLACETWGRLAADKSNVLLLFTGLSPSAHAASSPADHTPGWWEEMLGPDKPLDTKRFHVICINSIGSCFGSTGPASIDPATGRPYALHFPTMTLEDIATAAREALRAMDIPRVRVVMGPSLGGMSALAYVMLFPGEADALVSISSATHSEPFSIAVRSLQREIDPFRSSVERRRISIRRRSAPRHATGAQARHDDVPFRQRMGRAFRP